jgi:tRNA A37 methylthiotransferase MiaB
MYSLQMNTKRLYLHTIGCQMNVYDSEQIAMQLAAIGYEQTARLDDADLIIVNTCTVRAKAEQKAFSFLGRLAKMKRHKKRLIIGVGGCVAQQEGQRILDRMPAIDLVFGTQAIDRIPHRIQQIETRHCRIVDVDMVETPDIPNSLVGRRKSSQVSKFVTIMRGCDNYCAYCVVPFVRGRETSRQSESIVGEIKALVDNGVKEVTLLGQNVNSYGKNQNLCSFAELLAMINEIDFDQTLQLVEAVEFDGLFAFQYSDRPPAPAVKLPDKISASIISNRLQEILAVQDQLTRNKNQQLVGSNQWVLTDGLSKKEAAVSPVGSEPALQWTGRTSTNKIVNFYVEASTANNPNLTGKMVGVHIDKGYSHSLSGRAVNLEPSLRGLKGVENYAA